MVRNVSRDSLRASIILSGLPLTRTMLPASTAMSVPVSSRRSVALRLELAANSLQRWLVATRWRRFPEFSQHRKIVAKVHGGR